MYRTLFVLMVIGTCAGVAGFTLLTPSGIAIFAAVKAKRWWCPAKSFALWIFKSQLVHKNARSSADHGDRVRLADIARHRLRVLLRDFRRAFLKRVASSS